MMGLRNSVGVEKWFGFFSAEEAVKGGRHDGWVDDETRVCRFGYDGCREGGTPMVDLAAGSSG